MKKCPNCKQENPQDRVLCLHCGRQLEEETKTRKIINSIWGIVGGMFLILLDTDMVLSIGHLIPIPYGLSLIGIGVILIYLENIIHLVSPNSSLGINTAEQSIQVTTVSSSLLKAIILGLIAGGIAAGIWYGIAITTRYHFGVFAIAVGWVIGKFMIIGYGKDRELLLQITSVIICLSILLLNEYFIMRHFFLQSLVRKDFSSVPVFLPLDISLSLLYEAWRNEPISVLFWIVSVVSAFSFSGGLYINKPFSKNDPKEPRHLQ